MPPSWCYTRRGVRILHSIACSDKKRHRERGGEAKSPPEAVGLAVVGFVEAVFQVREDHSGGRDGEGPTRKPQAMEYEMGSGNVFADLELDDADELLTRAQLGHTVRMILAKKKLRQPEIATLLGIDQAEVSKLMTGQYHLFSCSIQTRGVLQFGHVRTDVPDCVLRTDKLGPLASLMASFTAYLIRAA